MFINIMLIPYVPRVLTIGILYRYFKFHPSHFVIRYLSQFYFLQDYLKSAALVCEVFKRHGIGLVTLQPEFLLAALCKLRNLESRALCRQVTEQTDGPCDVERFLKKCSYPAGSDSS